MDTDTERPEFKAAMAALLDHTKTCVTCAIALVTLNGGGMFCDEGRRLANTTDRAVGKDPRF